MPLSYLFSIGTWPVWGTFVAAAFIALASIFATANQTWKDDQKTAQITAQSVERDAAIQAFLGAASQLVQRQVSSDAEMSAFSQDYGALQNGDLRKRLEASLSGAEVLSIFAPALNVYAVNGSFNDQHGAMRATLYRYIDQLRLLAAKAG